MPLTPAQRQLYGRVGGYLRAASGEMPAVAARGREAFNQTFVDRVRTEHPDLPEVEVLKRAGALRKAHFAGLAAASVAARRARRAEMAT
jgi:hypothetical protein